MFSWGLEFYFPENSIHAQIQFAFSAGMCYNKNG